VGLKLNHCVLYMVWFVGTGSYLKWAGLSHVPACCWRLTSRTHAGLQICSSPRAPPSVSGPLMLSCLYSSHWPGKVMELKLLVGQQSALSGNWKTEKKSWKCRINGKMNKIGNERVSCLCQMSLDVHRDANVVYWTRYDSPYGPVVAIIQSSHW